MAVKSSPSALILVGIVVTKPLWGPFVTLLTHSPVTFDVMDIIALVGAALIWYGDNTFNHEDIS